MKNISIFLVDDHAIVREGLGSLLELSGKFNVIGEAADGHKAMPSLNGFEVVNRLRRELPDTTGLTRHAIATGVIEGCHQAKVRVAGSVSGCRIGPQ